MSAFDQGRIRVGHHYQATLPPVSTPPKRDSDALAVTEWETRYWPPVNLRLDDAEIDDFLRSVRSKLQQNESVNVCYKINDSLARSNEAHRALNTESQSQESMMDEHHVMIALDVLYDATSVQDALDRFIARTAALTGCGAIEQSSVTPGPRSIDSALLSGVYTFGEARWTEEERAMFVRAIRSSSKDFGSIRSAQFSSKSVKEVIAFYYKWKRTTAGRQVMDTIKQQRKAGSIINEGGVQQNSPRSRDGTRSATKRSIAKEDRDADWRETTSSKVRRSTSASITSRASRYSDHATRRKAEAESESDNDDQDEMVEEDARGLPIVPSPPPSSLHEECLKKSTGLFLRVWKRVDNSCARADLTYKSMRTKSSSQQQALTQQSQSVTPSNNANLSNIGAGGTNADVKVEVKMEVKSQPSSSAPRNPVGSGPAKWNLPTASVKPERSFSLIEQHTPASSASNAVSRQVSFPPNAGASNSGFPPELAAFYQKLAQAGAASGAGGLDPFGLASKSAEMDASAFERQLREMALLEHARSAAIAAASASNSATSAGPPSVASFEQFCKSMLALNASQQSPQPQSARGPFDPAPNPFSSFEPASHPFGLPSDSNALLNMLQAASAGAPFRQSPFPNPLGSLATAPPFQQLAAFSSLLGQQIAPSQSPIALGSPPPSSAFANNPLHAALQRAAFGASNAGMSSHSHSNQPPLAHAHDRAHPPPTSPFENMLKSGPFESLMKAAQFNDASRPLALAALTQQLAAHAAPAPSGSPFKLPALGGLGLSQLGTPHAQPNPGSNRAPSGPAVPLKSSDPNDPSKLNLTVNISMRESQNANSETTESKASNSSASNQKVDSNVNLTVAPPTAAIIPMHTHTHTHFHLHSQSSNADGTPASTSTDSQATAVATMAKRSNTQPPRIGPQAPTPTSSSSSTTTKNTDHGRPHSSVKTETPSVAPAASTSARPPAGDDAAAASRQLEQFARAMLALQQTELPAAGMPLPVPGLGNLPVGLPGLPGLPPFAQPPAHASASGNANANATAQAQLLANLASALQSFGAPFRN